MQTLFFFFLNQVGIGVVALNCSGVIGHGATESLAQCLSCNNDTIFSHKIVRLHQPSCSVAQREQLSNCIFVAKLAERTFMQQFL